MTNYNETRSDEMGALSGFPTETPRRKPRLLVIGHARHGKDTVGDMIKALMDLAFTSSSVFVGRECVWPHWGRERYTTFDEMFEDRVNFRSTWANLILAYNTPDLSRTATEMLKDNDMYVGMRNKAELSVCKANEVFDYIIWVDASARLPMEGKESMQLIAADANLHIDNNGPEENLNLAVHNLQKRLHNEGFEVNYKVPMSELLSANIPYKGGAAAPIREVLSDMSAVEADRAAEYAEEQREAEDDDLRKTVIGENPEDRFDEDAYDDLHRTYKGEDPEPEFNPAKVRIDLEGNRRAHNAALMATCNPPPQVPWPHSEPHTIVVEGTITGRWRNDRENVRDWTDMPEGAVRVLDHGFFKVLETMGSDQTICESARMSYGRGTKKVSNNPGLINYLVRNHHTSPLEMGEIRFHIRMPIFVMRQWVRHRTANLNEYSGRYSEMVRLFYVPDNSQICLQDKVNKQGSAEPMDLLVAEEIAHAIQRTSSYAFDVYEGLLKEGLSRETARMILPLNTYTEVVWKLDVSNLIKFLWLRDDDHAQWEIQQYAKLVSVAVEECFPLVFAAYKEARASETFSQVEIAAMLTGNYDDLSASQAKRIADLVDNLL